MKGYARLTYRSRARRITSETDSSCASAFSSAASHRSSGMRTLRSGVDAMSGVRVNQRAAARAAQILTTGEELKDHGCNATAVGDAIFNHGHVDHRVPASSGGAHGSSSVGVPVGTQYRSRVPTQAPGGCLYTTVTKGAA